MVRSAPGPAGPGPSDTDRGQELGEAGAVVDVAAGEHERQGSADAVTDMMDLGGQSTSTSAEGVILWFVRFSAPPLPPAAC